MINMVKWVQILDVLHEEDNLGLVINLNDLIGIKWFKTDFLKDYKDTEEGNLELLNNICNFCEEYRYIDPSSYQLLYDARNIVMGEKPIGSWVSDTFYFRDEELCS